MRNLTYRRITAEDLADAPKGSWKEKLLYAINLFFQQMYYGTQNQFTPEENDICVVKTFTLIAGATAADNTFSFTTPYNYQPSRLTMGKVVPTVGSAQIFTVAPFPSWNFTNGTLNILGVCGLTAGVAYNITVEVRWPPIIN